MIRIFQGIHPTLGDGAYVDESALVLGKVTLGADTSIWPMVTVRGDVHSISIGARTNVQDSSVLHVTQDNRFTPGGHGLEIGNNVTIGHKAILHGCIVEDFALVGMGSIVLDGAVVKSRAMLAAGSLVSPGKVLESGYLWLGRPAKPVRPLTAAELDYLEYSAQHYVDLKNKHML